VTAVLKYQPSGCGSNLTVDLRKLPCVLRSTQPPILGGIRNETLVRPIGAVVCLHARRSTAGPIIVRWREQWMTA